MGSVISLDERRRARAAGRTRARRATFWFDLADPGTYLAAERVERLPVPAAWSPARLPGLPSASVERAQRRAAELGLPMVMPDRPARAPVRAMRVAVHAAGEGRAAQYVLAATRLAFCGGFDLEDPEVLAEAAGAAGLDLAPALAAANAPALDAPIADAGRFLAAHGARLMPVLQAGRVLFAGEARLAEAAAALRGDPATGVARQNS